MRDNGGIVTAMQITGVTPQQFSDIVAKVSANAYQNNLKAELGSQQSPTRFRGRVILAHTGYQLWGGKDTSLLAPGQRRSASAFSNGRRINAVCWHVYRDVLRELFNAYPEARVYTAMAKYKGRDGFEANYPATAHQNIGSMAYPMTMPETCDCGW